MSDDQVGTHMGRINDLERRNARQAKRWRTLSHAPAAGSNGIRRKCSDYPECHHRKHSVPDGRHQ